MIAALLVLEFPWVMVLFSVICEPARREEVGGFFYEFTLSLVHPFYSVVAVYSFGPLAYLQDKWWDCAYLPALVTFIPLPACSCMWFVLRGRDWDGK